MDHCCHSKGLALSALLFFLCVTVLVHPALAAGPPLVMLAMSKDESYFHKAYPDQSDLDGDGVMDTTYNDAFEYYGYFHPRLCYDYNDTSDRFEPTGATDGSGHQHYCTGAQAARYGGNFLNWSTMTRMDIVRKVLYGGKRSTDGATETVLERAHLPPDAHSYTKYYNLGDLNKLTPFDTRKTDTTNSGDNDGFDDADEGITICNTSYAASGSSQASTAPPVMRIVYGNRQLWAANERWQCTWESERGDNANSNSSAQSGIDAISSDPPDNLRLLTTPNNKQDRVVRVVVCNPIYYNAGSNLENCQQYPNGNLKPAGVLQRYGESSLINFGLVSGSWQKNISGGALRKNVGTMADEINIATNGTFKAAPVSGGIINTLNLMRIWGYGYNLGTYRSDDSGGDNCDFQLASIVEGRCAAWGNPISEIYLEALRYFAVANPGRAPTAAFNPDDTTYLSGMTDASWAIDPLTTDNADSRLHIVVINAGIASYDDNATNSAILGGTTSQALTQLVGNGDSISGNSYFIGKSGAATDEFCSAKIIASLGDAYGLCPEGPTLQGSFHMAGLAYFARTHDLRADLPGFQDVSTFGVALVPSVPTVVVPIGAVNAPTQVKVLPAYRLSFNVTGGTLVDFKVVRKHTEVDATDRASPGLPNATPNGVADIINGVPQVSFPVAKTGTGIYHAKFYINWEDSEQGGDFDQDMWGTLDYVVNTNVTPATVTVTTNAIAQSTGGQQLFGFIISGTTKDGFHAYSGILGGNFTDPQAGVPGCSNCRALSEGGGQSGPQSYTFTVSASSSTKFLETPLYYAAKWGGFDDANGNGVPDQAVEWDAHDGDGVPDNYVQVSNPAALQGAITAVFARIAGPVGPDFDGDGQPDTSDPDDDNDGLPDVWESQYGLNPLNAADAASDLDSDGRSNLVEYQQGTNPTVSEPDTDGDGSPDVLDADDDNDGLPDVWESQYDLNPLNAADAASDLDGDGRSNLVEYQQGTNPTVSEPDTDGDGLLDTSDPDDDNDGLPDQWELDHGFNPLNSADAAADTDGDGRSNLVEYQQGTNPSVSEPDSDGDGSPNVLDADDDNDGLPDQWELDHGFNPLNSADAAADTDGDGRSNLVEYQQGTNPSVSEPDSDGDGSPNVLDADDDNDGLPDQWELDHGFNPLNAADGAADADGDGLSNLAEYQQGTNPGVANVMYRLEFTLQVERRETAAGNDPTFTPFTTHFTLNFDPTWVRTDDYGHEVAVFFAAGNRFESPLTALLPWRPPAGLAPERRMAAFENIVNPPFGFMYWDDSYYHHDTSAMREYRYGVSLNSNPSGNGQHIGAIASFKTDELLAFLEGLRVAGAGFEFNEIATIGDSISYPYAAYLSYSGTARIEAIVAPAAAPTQGPASTQIPVPAWALVVLAAALIRLGARRSPIRA